MMNKILHCVLLFLYITFGFSAASAWDKPTKQAPPVNVDNDVRVNVKPEISPTIINVNAPETNTYNSPYAYSEGGIGYGAAQSGANSTTGPIKVNNEINNPRAPVGVPSLMTLPGTNVQLYEKGTPVSVQINDAYQWYKKDCPSTDSLANPFSLTKKGEPRWYWFDSSVEIYFHPNSDYSTTEDNSSHVNNIIEGVHKGARYRCVGFIVIIPKNVNVLHVDIDKTARDFIRTKLHSPLLETTHIIPRYASNIGVVVGSNAGGIGSGAAKSFSNGDGTGMLGGALSKNMESGFAGELAGMAAIILTPDPEGTFMVKLDPKEPPNDDDLPAVKTLPTPEREISKPLAKKSAVQKAYGGARSADVIR